MGSVGGQLRNDSEVLTMMMIKTAVVVVVVVVAVVNVIHVNGSIQYC